MGGQNKESKSFSSQHRIYQITGANVGLYHFENNKSHIRAPFLSFIIVFRMYAPMPLGMQEIDATTGLRDG
jgi:hypothetical protein